uniref:Endonuclease/exonuclease/phosphatase domain-containing protein n=1 Tax=Ditylenchus dipsaci TaxID=166011 RepID=A0A915EMF5_9BILA
MECAQADYQVITNEFSSGYDFESKEASKTAPLRVVTFNIWLSGARVSNGLVKIAKQISQLNPDIVALQEIESDSVISNLTKLLGKPWTGVGHTGRNYTDTGILTRHKILQDQLVQVSCGNGVPIVVDVQGSSFTVNFFSMHLNYTSYGPYAAQNKMVTQAEQIYKGEKTADGKGRVSNMQELLDNSEFQAFLQDAEKKGHPLFVAGDFNCPSHQDWTENTKHLHGDWVFEWPVTKLLTGIGMVDSFRQLHPNVLEMPGYTWSTVQNRVDLSGTTPSQNPRPTRLYLLQRQPKQHKASEVFHIFGQCC